MFVVETALGGSTQTDVLVRLGAKVTPLVAAGEYWRLFTSMFLHIGVAHLFFNGYALLVVGTELERLLGWGRFLAIYLLSGLLGSLASYAFSANLSAGASGAIFGLIGALGAFFFLHRERLGSWGRARLGNIAVPDRHQPLLWLHPAGHRQPGPPGRPGGRRWAWAGRWRRATSSIPSAGKVVDRNQPAALLAGARRWPWSSSSRARPWRPTPSATARRATCGAASRPSSARTGPRPRPSWSRPWPSTPPWPMPAVYFQPGPGPQLPGAARTGCRGLRTGPGAGARPVAGPLEPGPHLPGTAPLRRGPGPV